MTVVLTPAELRAELARRSRPVVFVPTMGALHEGHVSLMRIARERGSTVVASIYVNPMQFGPSEDLDAYPKPLESDLEKCEAVGVDLVFTPPTLYADDSTISIHESRLSFGLCGASRPGHFDGVCTVVAKLFNLVQPDAAVFGEKDFQQLAVIRRMVRDLDFPVEIIGGPIIRESDGLAMSSRNVYLSPDERSQAVVLNRTLARAREAIENGERSAAAIEKQIREHLEFGEIDYVAVVDPDTLEPLEEVGQQLLVAIAVFFGKTRLIDNLCLRSLDAAKS
ncbi:MAG: pantoate--beta-alanine ligase [Verrucomicrobiales bacterium]|jgi:pantoate--beta-alanine ligase